MSRVARALPALATGILLLLTGCGGTVSGRAAFGGDDPAKPTARPAGPAGADPAADPVMGACYTIGQGQESNPLDAPAPVDCSGTHNAETARVTHSGLGAGAPYPTRDDLDSDRVLKAALDEVCSFRVIADYLGGDELDEPYAFYAPYLPSQQQWAAGARWVRCDVFYGYSSPETAPGILAGALGGPTAVEFRACFAGTPGDYRTVPCSQPHDAEPVRSFPDVTSGTPYPADPAARQALAGSCAADVQQYAGGAVPAGYAIDVYVGPQSSWADSLVAQCVLVPAAGGQTTTSVRG